MADQIITPELETETVSVGDSFSLDVNYTTDPAETPTTGIQFRLHWDSSKLEFDPTTDLENTFDLGVQPILAALDDPEENGGFDGDPDTDKFFVQAWVDIDGNFIPPRDNPTLYTANFTALPGVLGETSINFTPAEVPPDFEFDATSATIEVIGDEPPPLPGLSIDDVTVTEGDSGDIAEAVFTVTLLGPSDSTVTVDYSTADGTATEGEDYMATSGTLTFEEGETSQTITVEVLGDTIPEPNETFFVNLNNVTDNIEIEDASGEGTISDDDGLPPPPQIFDVIQGTSDDEILQGTPENNVLIALAGNDILNGMGGEDILFGGSGDDNLNGGMGDDLIYGGDGNDLILGASGNDTLIGEAGQDFMLGGSGSDIFVFSPMGATPFLAQADAIVDFNVAEDAIGLDGGLTRDGLMLEGKGTNTLIRLAENGEILAVLNRVMPDQLTDDNFQSVNIGLF